ncbi:MAG: radical SAM protein [Bacteroidales bacterium]|nr:radical SAM protein [Bacteroidales bacterium]
MRVNELFYSLQGEGYHTGTAAIFIRLSGCNLHCPFCDTLHESGTEMSEEQIVEQVAAWPSPWVVVTGGEPSLSLTPSLVEALHQIGKKVAVETNGTRPLPNNVDWVTLSPKDLFLGTQARVTLRRADELKVVFDGVHEPDTYSDIDVRYRFLQPCDTGDPDRNRTIVQQTVEYIKAHPEWRLSLQTHKLLNIP